MQYFLQLEGREIIEYVVCVKAPVRVRPSRKKRDRPMDGVQKSY